MELFENLERELKELEISLKYASEKDLPIRVVTLRVDSTPVIYTTLEKLSDYRLYLRNEIKSKKRDIELLKLKLGSNLNELKVESTSDKKEPPDEIDSQQPKGNSQTPRLRGSQRWRENINKKIYDEIERLLDKGVVQNQTYKELAMKSEELLGIKFTSGAIKGRYERLKKNKT